LLDENWNVVGALVAEGQLATEQANYTPFDVLAEDTDCEIHETADINSSGTKEWLKRIDPDICLCGGWSQIINEEILNIPENGFIGFHSSKLPAGRGGAPVNWSLLEGADEVWISMFYYTTAVDAGDIITQGSVPVEPRDDVGTVFDALAQEACSLASSVHEDLAQDRVNARPQGLADATYRPRRQPQDGLITWSHENQTVDNWVRGLTRPYPGSYTFYNGNRITVWRGKPVETSTAGAVPGEIIRIVDGSGIDVSTGNGTFRVTRIQKDEGPPRWADRLAREMGISSGERFSRELAPEKWCYTGLQRLLGPKRFNTNLEVGEIGVLTLLSHTGSQRDLSVRVSIGNELLFEESRTVTSEYSEQVEYSFSEPGRYTISVDFNIDGEHVDTRYLKVFVHD
jgi:methionyl-tRNA formyltransferase